MNMTLTDVFLDFGNLKGKARVGGTLYLPEEVEVAEVEQVAEVVEEDAFKDEFPSRTAGGTLLRISVETLDVLSKF